MKKILLAQIFLVLAIGVFAQSSIVNKGVIFIGNGTKLTIQGNYIHQSSSDGLQVDNGGELLLTGDFVNESATSVSEGYTGKVTFNGTSMQAIRTTGFDPALLHEIEIQNAAGLQLDGPSHIAGSTSLTTGSIDLSDSDLHFVLLPEENSARLETAGELVGEGINRLFTMSTGKALTDAREFTSPELNNYVDIAGLGASVKIEGFLLGDVSVERAHLQMGVNSNNESIHRTYKISVRDAAENLFTLLPAALRFQYLDSELGTIGAHEAAFSLFKSTDNGVSWKNQGGTAKAAENQVELNGIADLNGLWAVSYCVPPDIALGNDIALCPDGTTTLTASPAGTAPFTYKWMRNSVEVANQTAPTLEVTVENTAVNYTVIVTDAKGCTQQDEILITIRALPVVELGPEVSVCANLSSALDAGPGFSTYRWTNEAGEVLGTNQIFNASNTGEYKIEISDASGCTNKDSVVVAHKDLPKSNLAANTATCGDQFILGTGLSDLNTGATYLWRDSQNTLIGAQSTTTVTASGSYSVTIKGSNGCEISAATSVTLNTTQLGDLGEDKKICANSSVALSAVRSNSSYLWSTGATTPSINFSVEETDAVVWVEITDLASHCTGRDSVRVIVEALPVVNLGENISVCEGGTAVLDAGPAAASYLWNDQSTGQNLLASTAGTYTVEVTNTFGCKNTDTIQFGFFEPIRLNFAAETATCGTEIELGLGLSALNPSSTYLWNTGATTSTIKVDQQGDYSVVVTDANGCRKTGGTKAILNAAEFVNLGPDIQLECQSVTIDAGNPGSSYHWSDGSSTRTILVSKPGKYSVSVTNSFGCTDSDEIDVILLPPADSAFFLSATEAAAADTVYFIGLTTTATVSTTWDFDDGPIMEGNSLLAFHQYHVGGQYRPSLTTFFPNGCTDKYTKKVTITAMEEAPSPTGRERTPLIENVVIYPNPNNGRFKVDVALSEQSPVSLLIVNSMGLTVSQPHSLAGQDFYQVDYDLSGINPGVYILTIAAGSEGRKYRVLIRD